MTPDIPTGFCNADLIFIFVKYFLIFLILSYIFLYFNLQMLLQMIDIKGCQEKVLMSPTNLEII